VIDEPVTSPDGDDLVFNMVWTDEAFTFLEPFFASLLDHSRARFRLIANRCPTHEVERMERFAAARPDRVVEVHVLSAEIMVPHGVALDEVRRVRDDGPFFCFVDPDILARRDYLPRLVARLGSHAAVTSGTQVWSDGNELPSDMGALPGDYFFRDGFVYGSPHCAMYHVDALVPTLERWDIGFGSHGPDLAPATWTRLDAIGHRFSLYDTGKLVNILLQADGHSLCHMDEPALVHIGGLLHYFSARQVETDTGPEPEWAHWGGATARFEVARYTAHAVRALHESRPAPPVPAGSTPAIDRALAEVRDELIRVFATYRTDERPALPTGQVIGARG
jgi:hypothetical protein